jgi:general secretion pathway protein D
VNAGGLITLEVKQEVTGVARTTTSGIDAPTFQQRSIESTISVNSGNTVVLGGLIRDNRSGNNSGVPGLHKIPFIGPLFGQSSDNLERTELVILLTPRAIQNEEDSWRITNEFKEKLRDVEHSLKRDPNYFLQDE